MLRILCILHINLPLAGVNIRLNLVLLRVNMDYLRVILEFFVFPGRLVRQESMPEAVLQDGFGLFTSCFSLEVGGPVEQYEQHSFRSEKSFRSIETPFAWAALAYRSSFQQLPHVSFIAH